MQQGHEHPADKYNIDIIEAMDEVKKFAEANKLTQKQVRIVYKALKTNAIIVRRYFVLPETDLVNAQGENINMNEETVYQVLMVGEQTDDYQIKLKQGDLILSMRPPMPTGHLKATQAVTAKEGGGEVDLSYYGILSPNDVIAVVEYERL